MKINLVGMTQEIIAGAELLKEHLGFEIADDGIDLTVKKCRFGFEVSVNDSGAEIGYQRPSDFFRAFAIATDALKNRECIELAQTAAFDSCGVMIDISRRAALKVEKIKDIMLSMACMGLNRLLIYNEDMYELESHPYFGYMRGRYTVDELKEIVRFGNMLGIETVPCIQTLAHLTMTLRWDEFADVRDTADILLVGEDKTYALIEDMIKTMRECFTTSIIHIGMDEAHDVGLGRYLQKHGYTDRFQILSEHLSRTVEIVRKYGFEPMMWSDMFFHLAKFASNAEDKDTELPEDISSIIPEGITQVYWDYYSCSEKHYYNKIIEHKKMKCPVAFAGGIWTWSGPCVNYVQTFESTLPALKVCREQGVKDVFATLWGDDGSECDMHQALYGMQLYAEINYSDFCTKAQLDKMFKLCTGCDAGSFLLFDADNYYDKVCSPEIRGFEDGSDDSGILTFSKQVLYQNPMLGLFDKNFENLDLKSHYTKLYQKLNEISVCGKYECLFECHKQLVKVLMQKCDIGIRLKAAYDKKDMSALSDIAAELNAIAGDIEKLYDLRRSLWYGNNKPFGFEAVGNRLAGVAAMTKTAYRRVSEFADGKTDSLDELEQERLYFTSNGKPFVCEYLSARIMMP